MQADQIARAFNDCINARDLDALAALMTEDHAFTDTRGQTVAGKAACVEAWRGFFAQFPDYRNHFTDVRSRGDLAVIVGFSTCSFDALDGPALWTAATREGKVAHWRVYSDTPQTRAELQL